MTTARPALTLDGHSADRWPDRTTVPPPNPEAVVTAASSRPGHQLLRRRPVPRHTESGLLIERRQKDGLGLLPRAADPTRRRARHRANQALGFALIVFGGTVMGCSLAFIQRGETVLGAVALMLGLITLAQGVWLVGRQERRGRTPVKTPDRRRSGR